MISKKPKTKEQIECYMLYLKTKGGVTVPLLGHRRTYFSCNKFKQKLEREIGDLNGYLIIKH